MALIAPKDHPGLTTEAQPTLYWHLSEVIAQPFELVVREEGKVTPLVLRTLATPTAAGFQEVSLSEIGVSLRPNVVYEWSIAIAADPEQGSRGAEVARAEIRRIEPEKALRERLDRAGPSRKVTLYAESGFWYDAIDVVSQSIRAEPNAEGPRQVRSGLLEQVGLGALAAE